MKTTHKNLTNPNNSPSLGRLTSMLRAKNTLNNKISKFSFAAKAASQTREGQKLITEAEIRRYQAVTYAYTIPPR